MVLCGGAGRRRRGPKIGLLRCQSFLWSVPPSDEGCRAAQESWLLRFQPIHLPGHLRGTLGSACVLHQGYWQMSPGWIGGVSPRVAASARSMVREPPSTLSVDSRVSVLSFACLTCSSGHADATGKCECASSTQLLRYLDLDFALPTKLFHFMVIPRALNSITQQILHQSICVRT